MDPIFFLHIPKTAGTSLRLWLKQALPEVGCGDLFYPREFAAASDADIGSRALIAGHFGYAEVERARRIKPTIRVISMLRHPRTVAHSMFSALARIDASEVESSLFRDADGTAITRQSYSDGLRSFLKSDDGDGIMADYQLRRLLADGNPGEGWSLSPYRKHQSDDVDRGLGNLLDFAAFGIIEHYDQSCMMICDALGWPWLGSVSQHNVHNTEIIIDRANDDLLKRDLSLFERAKAAFEQRWADLCARMGADPAAPDHGLHAVAEGLDRRALETLPAATSDWTGVEDGLFARGLGERFFYEPEQRWLRNMTGDMTVFAPCRADARRLSLCFGYILPEPEKVSLCVNGMATAFDIRYEQEPGGAWRIWLDADLPADRRRAVVATVRSAPDVTAQGSFLGFASA